ncbi:MAG TPA: helix-turn-helix domain-containing protein [Acidimicrobiales bacterium]|nr:helix-turn-helix domain-containing protein [Acidimicrobiales bacterium]
MLVQQEALLEPPLTIIERRPRPSVRGPVAVRASLVAAAGELFAARGTASVSVREIADRAGVNHGLIHHYFHSKQGLIDATLEDLADQATKALEDGPDLSPDGPLARYVLVASRALLDADQTARPDAGPLGLTGASCASGAGAGGEAAGSASVSDGDGADGGRGRATGGIASLNGAGGEVGANGAAVRDEAAAGCGGADLDANRGMVELLRRLAELSADSHASGTETRLRAAQLAALMIGWLLFEPVLVNAAGLSNEDPAWIRRQLLRSALM